MNTVCSDNILKMADKLRNLMLGWKKALHGNLYVHLSAILFVLAVIFILKVKNASGKMRKKLLHLLTIISFRVTALRQQPPCVYGMRTQVICLTWLTLIKEIISVRLKSVLQLKTFPACFILMILPGRDVNYACVRNIS